jgi:Gas vesicle protein G
MLLKLLTAPITLPISGFRFVLNRVEEMAERELYDEERIREELLLLQLRLDEGEVSEEEYAVEEADVIARLRAAREYRRQQQTQA